MDGEDYLSRPRNPDEDEAVSSQRPGAHCGRLTVYFGSAPGVGKTFAMLDEAERRRRRGTDVVVGLVETHGRAGTASKLGELEIIPRREISYRGTTLTEMDTEAILERRPEVVLVDELAHTNAPGSAHPKRWQDVVEILEAGIDVVTTVNVQHLGSLTDDVEAITGVRQRETLPDQVVRDADQIQLVDLSPQQLRRRLAHGNIYRAEQIDASLTSYFRVGNLTALRELALLWLADRVDDALTRYRADHAISGKWPARERIVVSLSGGPEGETLLRRGARIAQRAAGAELLAVHVLPTDGLPAAPAAALASQRTLVESLGGTFHTVVGEDVAMAVVEFAQGVNATMIVVGVSRHSRVREAFLGSSGNEIARLAGSIDVHLVTHEHARSGSLRRARWSPLSTRRRVAGLVLALAVPAVLTVVFSGIRSDLSLSTQIVLFLAGVVGVALIGGLWPAVVCAILSFLCLNWFFTQPTGMFTIADPENVLALVLFVLVAAAVASVVDLAARRTVQAYQARAESSTLAALSRSVLTGQDTADAIVDRIAEIFGLARVQLDERADDRSEWSTVAFAERVDALAGNPRQVQETTDVLIDDLHRLHLSGRALPASDRQVLEAFGVQAGIVLETRRLRDRAARAKVLEETDATRTALLAAVSHDLRTPLASIRAAVDGLTAADVQLDPEDSAVLAGTIAQSTERLERLIDNLLDLSRIQTGALRPIMREVSLEEIVPLAVEPYLLGDAGAPVVLDLAEDLPLVRTDPGLLERVVANVVANGVRHSPVANPVVVAASATRDEIHIRVVDTGKGVPDDRKEHMFEPFQRLGDVTGTGLGLGLAVAKGLATATGASLTAEDTPGGGLTMILAVPRAKGDDDEAEFPPILGAEVT